MGLNPGRVRLWRLRLPQSTEGAGVQGSCPRPGLSCPDRRGPSYTPSAHTKSPSPDKIQYACHLVPGTEARGVCTQDILPKRSQAILGPVPCPQKAARKRGRTQISRSCTGLIATSGFRSPTGPGANLSAPQTQASPHRHTQLQAHRPGHLICWPGLWYSPQFSTFRFILSPTQNQGLQAT